MLAGSRGSGRSCRRLRSVSRQRRPGDPLPVRRGPPSRPRFEADAPAVGPSTIVLLQVARVPACAAASQRCRGATCCPDAGGALGAGPDVQVSADDDRTRLRPRVNGPVNQPVGRIGSSADCALVEAVNASVTRETLQGGKRSPSAAACRRDIFRRIVRYNMSWWHPALRIRSNRRTRVSQPRRSITPASREAGLTRPGENR